MAKTSKRTWTTLSGESRTAWAVTWTDQNMSRHRKQFKTKVGAEQFRVDIEGKLARGTFRADSSTTTVEKLWLQFIEHYDGLCRRREITPRHLENLRSIAKNFFLNESLGIGSTTIAQLSTRAVGQFRDRLRDKGVSTARTRKIIGLLSTMLEFARENDLVSENAARGIKIRSRRDEQRQEIVIPSKEDIRTLLRAADVDFRDELLFAITTGTRAGEQRAATYADINFKTRMLTVNKRVDALGNVDAPKSRAAYRDIPLSDVLIRTLLARRLRSAYSMDDDFVFAGKDGNFTRHDNAARKHFKPLLQKTGVGSFRWHDLRHFAISTWIEAGLSAKAVQTFAGHSAIAITMDRYGHLFPSSDHNAAMDDIADQLI